MAEGGFRGLLCIGDPHLCSRVPGFRKDDYPNVILGKLRWALSYGREQRLLPVLLGDIFHYPRDNANWLMVHLMDLFQGEILAVPGNHDSSESALTEHDTLSVLLAAGKLRLIESRPWIGRMNGASLAVGGTHWAKRLPREIDRRALGEPRFVVWITHHDIGFPGHGEPARAVCREITGVDLVVNGHIHRDLGEVVTGSTTWCNPGNIARVNRGDATRAHVPGLLRIDVSPEGLERTRITVPHRPFEEVFHEEVREQPVEPGESPFIQGLAALRRLKTSGGEGLREFIQRNIERFEDPRVKAEILKLCEEVVKDG